MSRLVDVKIRRIGNSLGAVFPAALLKELGVDEDDEVSIAIYTKRPRRGERLEDLVGLFQGAGRFQREKEDRYD